MRQKSLTTTILWISVFAFTALIFTNPNHFTHAYEQTAEPTVAMTEDQPSYNIEQVKVASALARANAHLTAAQANWESGNTSFAAVHAGHTKAEIASIMTALKAKNADVEIGKALDDFSQLAGQSGDKTAFSNALRTAQDAIDNATDAMLGNLTNDPQFLGSVMQALLETSINEYQEAYKDGKIIEPIEYQDAKVFIDSANNYLTDILATSKYSNAGQVENFIEVQGQFDSLKKMFLDVVKLPEAPAKPEDVESTIDDLLGSLSDELTLPVFEDTMGNHTIADVKEMVADTLADYKAGKTDDAYEKAANAYLEGFEHVEADLVKKDKALMEMLEKQFKDLRDGIKAGKPTDEIEKLVQEINDNLDKADKLLES